MLELLLSLGEKIDIGPAGQMTWTTPGAYTWIVPEGVTSVCVCAVGQGQYTGPANYNGGQGGGLRYMNDIPVVPGTEYSIKVGSGLIAFNINTMNDITSGFGITAYPPGTTGPVGSVGFNGGTKVNSSHPSLPGSPIWEYGGSSATLTAIGTAGGKTQNTTPTISMVAKGINVIDGTIVSPTTQNAASAGGGSTGRHNTDGSGVGSPAGNGAFRIIWGKGRAYPNRLIGNI